MNAQSTIHLSPKQQATLKWIIRACPPDVYAANTLRREMNQMTSVKLAHLNTVPRRTSKTSSWPSWDECTGTTPSACTATSEASGDGVPATVLC